MIAPQEPPPRPIGEEELHAYVDGRLPPGRHPAILAYLDAHPDVAARVRAYTEQREALRALFAPAALAPIPPELNISRLVEGRLRRRGSHWRIAAALVLGLGLGAGGRWWLLRAPAGVDAIARDAAVGIGPMIASGGPAEAELEAAHAAAARVAQTLAPPDLAKAGYRLLGGQVLTGRHGSAAVFFYADAGGDRLMIFARPTDLPDTRSVAEIDVGPRDGCAWIEGGIGYALTADKPYADLLRLSREARATERATG